MMIIIFLRRHSSNNYLKTAPSVARLKLISHPYLKIFIILLRFFSNNHCKITPSVTIFKIISYSCLQIIIIMLLRRCSSSDDFKIDPSLPREKQFSTPV
jgi:hypothetical protein